MVLVILFSRLPEDGLTSRQAPAEEQDSASHSRVFLTVFILPTIAIRIRAVNSGTIGKDRC
jgi:hypothetical protein